MPAFLLPLLHGLAVTVVLTVAASALAIPVAVAAGLGRGAHSALLRAPARIYVETFRGTSALVQLYWFYFALPLLGIRMGAMAAGITVLALNTGAYGAEVVRGAIRAVPPGQTDASVALGLSRGQTLRRVILPQAAVAMLPPAGNLLVELLKNTALVSLVTVADLTFQAQVLRAATLRSGVIFGGVLVAYYLLAQAIAWGVQAVERRLPGRAASQEIAW